jgi:hypothetical protein
MSSRSSKQVFCNCDCATPLEGYGLVAQPDSLVTAYQPVWCQQFFIKNVNRRELEQIAAMKSTSRPLILFSTIPRPGNGYGSPPRARPPFHRDRGRRASGRAPGGAVENRQYGVPYRE